MFGHNVPRKREHGSRLQYHEVFYTIQGEGPFMGEPAVFIRLTGCNLRCWFCDTEWGDENDPHTESHALARIAASAGGARTKLAVITGGEPTRQDLDRLIASLKYFGFENIQVETAGTFWQDCLDDEAVTIVVSPKTGKVHPEYRKRRVNWKYVIRSGEVDPSDGLPSAPMQRTSGGIGGGVPARPNPGDPVFLQPVDEHEPVATGTMETNVAAMVESSLRYGYRAGLQMHKIMGLA